MLVEKISALQKAISELEDCKVTLEEKLMQMEGGLILAKEVPCVQDVELKNELSQIKKANSQYQRKIQLLEEERDRCTTKEE